MGNTLHPTMYWHLQAQTPTRFRLFLSAMLRIPQQHPCQSLATIHSIKRNATPSHYSVGSYAPDGMIVAHDGRDGFSHCLIAREAQPVYHFSETGPSPFDLSSTHQTTTDPQNLWLGNHDPLSVIAHQDAQTLDTLGSGLEFSVGDLS